MDMLAEIQGWAPAGGFVRSEWRQGAKLEPGDLFRHDGAWAVITARGQAVTRDGRGEVIDKSPAYTWRDMHDESGTHVLWHAVADGVEVRTDTRIDPGTIPAA